MTVSLIGLPGCGKSTVGRQLAKRLGYDFVDSDEVIEKLIASPIRAFFEREGEARFREIEMGVITALTTRARLVLATGGGAVLKEANRVALAQRTTVVYLRSTPEELYRRLQHDTQRPLLQVDNPLDKLKQLYRQRDAFYRETAHYMIETGRPSVASLVNMILMQLELSHCLPTGEHTSATLPPAGHN